MFHNRFKPFNFILLISLVLSACGSLNTADLIPNVDIPDMDVPVISDMQDQSIDIPAPPVPDQPLFGEEIYNALEACPDLNLNEICLGSGSSSGVDLGMPGGRVLLTGGEQISVASSSLNDYSVVIARLQAPGVDADFNSLLVLAIGSVDVSFDEIFYGRDETNLNLPRLTFSSTNGADFQSGVVIINESDEDLLGIEVNGVGMTLGSTAVVTSQPAGEMKVTMQTGTVAASANEETVSAVKGESINVQMTEKSKPASAPQGIGVEDDLLTPLVPPKQPTTLEFTRENYNKFESAYNRCMSGDARQVYRLMYFANLLLNNQNLDRAQRIREYLTPVRINEMKEKVKKCATFDLILDSDLTGSSAISWTTWVHGEALKLQFDENGKLVSQVQGLLATESFDPSMPLPPGCTSSTLIEDGSLNVFEGSVLRIYYNTMQIRLNVWPDDLTHVLSMLCPSAPNADIPLDWNIYYLYSHEDLFSESAHSYVIKDWEFFGNEVYAQSNDLNRVVPIEDGTATINVVFTLKHAPQK